MEKYSKTKEAIAPLVQSSFSRYGKSEKYQNVVQSKLDEELKRALIELDAYSFVQDEIGTLALEETLKAHSLNGSICDDEAISVSLKVGIDVIILEIVETLLNQAFSREEVK